MSPTHNPDLLTPSKSAFLDSLLAERKRMKKVLASLEKESYENLKNKVA
jgi:hypothetical protein